MVMGIWLIVLALCCLSGIFLNTIPLGLVFIMALFIVLNWIITIFQKEKFTDIGIAVTLIGIMSLAYTVCTLFLGINVDAILGF